MKAISIKEPWATMIHCGLKTLETRSWRTYHRGPLLLCVSQKPKTLHSGKAIGIMYITDVEGFQEKHEKAACCSVYKGFVWVIDKYVPLERPINIKGKQAIFEVDDNLIKHEKVRDYDKRN